MSEPVDVVAMRKRFEDAKLLGIVALIDYLLAREASGERIIKIGSASINITDKARSELTIFEIALLPGISFGRLDQTSSPLGELEALSKNDLSKFSVTGMERFNQVCADLAENDPEKWKLLITKSEVPVPRPVQ